MRIGRRVLRRGDFKSITLEMMAMLVGLSRKAPIPEMKGLRWDIDLSGISHDPMGLSVWWKCSFCQCAEKFLCYHSFGNMEAM